MFDTGYEQSGVLIGSLFHKQRKVRIACKAFIKVISLIPAYLWVAIVTVYLNVHVKYFRAETAKLPEIASQPRSITSQMRKVNCDKGYSLYRFFVILFSQ